ncbi:MAG: HlyD family efflux transporter periplasmic adaptor subunit [Mariprofundaceae bacterium]
MLPSLREELALCDGPRAKNGMPTYSLYDPLRNRYFRFGWPQFEMLRRWRLGDPGKIAEEVNRATTLNVEAENVLEVAMFLQGNNLVQVSGDVGLAMLADQAKAARRHWATWLLHNYLFLRVPLFHPDAFLNRTLPFVRFFFSHTYLWCMLSAATVGIYLISRQWESFLHTFSYFFSLQGLVFYALALIFTKIIHEFGHAYTACYFGVRVPTMGMGLLVMMPVMYTDTSDAWKLTDNHKRMWINAAGFLAEMSLAVLATLLWSFLPDGTLKSIAFLLATTTWVMTMMINMNPFMRWDGYYLFSDWMEVDNLQQRSFALARWRMREILFAPGEPVPEDMDTRLRRQLMLYAWVTWVYRFILFIGISALVYFFFFKLLGIFLMIVEVGWFIVLPIYTEMKEWWKRRDKVNNRAGYRSLAVFGLILLLLLVPWQTRVSLSGVLDSDHRIALYAPEDARMLNFSVRNGQHVEKGDVLVELSSELLNHRMAMLERQMKLLQWQTSAQGVSGAVAAEGRILRQQVIGETAGFNSLKERIARLKVRAPFSGDIVMVNLDAKQGDFVQRGEKLLSLVDSSQSMVRAYVFESDLMRFKAGAKARFYPDDSALEPIDMRVGGIDRASAKVLLDPPLASIYGGPIPVIQGKNGELIAQQAVYRVMLRPLQETTISKSIRGTVYIEGSRKSFLARFFNQVIAVVVRESGF